MIEAIIFDLDGTLIDTVYDLGNSMNIVLEKHGYKTHDIDAYYTFVGNGMRKLVERASYNQGDTDKLLEEFMDVYSQDIASESKVYDGIMEVLTTLNDKKIPIAICTNKRETMMTEMIHHYFKNINFEVCIGDRFNGILKPNPTYPLEIAEIMNANSENILFIGDTNVDVQTAKNAGMKSMGVLWGFRSKEELEEAGADYIIETPSQILDILK